MRIIDLAEVVVFHFGLLMVFLTAVSYDLELRLASKMGVIIAVSVFLGLLLANIIRFIRG